MSTRQLRKLQKQRELEALEKPVSEEGEESEDEVVPTSKPKPSLFSGFAALGGDEDQHDNDEDDEPETVPEKEEPERVDTPKSSAKKSKKKKKKAKKATEDTSGKEVAKSKDAPAQADTDDEIDQALRELNLKAQASGAVGNADTAPATIAYERICELLRINTYHLKVMNEMRNLFGREAMEAARAEEQEEEQNRTRRRGTQQLRQNVDLETYLKGQPGKSLPEVTLRRNPFLPGKETWPRASTDGLTMKQIKDGTVDSKCGTVEFGFAHDEHYNSMETSFFQLVQMYDPMQLVHFLHRHPYHISSLIQVSKVAKQDQNNALAGDLCERALFTFGRVSISAFRQKLEEGKARIEFKRPENRQFWLAVYHYLKSLTMKGTYRTALEWSKLLFSMDLSDPYGVVHFIHPLAVRAHESKWFIDFCDSEALDQCDTAQDYIRQTLVLARLQQKDTAGAKALAVEGMERLPWVYSAIFRALNLDVPRAIWGMEPRDEHEQLFTELYLHQTKQLWDNAQAIGLLKEAAALAQKPSLASLPSPPVAGRNVGRFVYLDNTPALMGLVPGGMLHGFPNWDFDPLPPAKNDNIFSYDSQSLPWNPDRPAPARGPGLQGLDLAGLGGRDALLRLLNQARQAGARADDLDELERAIAGLDADSDDDLTDPGVDEGEDTDGDEGAEGGEDGQRGIWDAFVDMIMPLRYLHRDESNILDVVDGIDVVAGGAPGGWPSDSDNEMPALIREAQEDSDNELPPLATNNGNESRSTRRQPTVEDDTDDEVPGPVRG
ncbi:Ribosome quality control complex subunit 1 [Seiridium cupressi]